MTRLAAISVDLDSLGHYCRIFGLPESVLSADAQQLVGTVAVPRYLELFDALKIPATLFVIGEDLERDDSASLVKSLGTAHRAGVELGNHSYSHDYAISRRSRPDIVSDLVRAEDVMQSKLGVTPKGFRAPGYTMTAALFSAVEARGYEYDSSTYPAAPYYAAKAMVMGALQLFGRPSRAILDSPAVMVAPRTPYHPNPLAPYARGTSKVVELPMAVSPVFRVPFIGAFATMFPWLIVEGAFRRLRHDALFNFELHAIDVLDESDGIPPELARRQRDVGVPVVEKLRRLKTLFAWLAEDRQMVTLLEASRRLRHELNGHA